MLCRDGVGEPLVVAVNTEVLGGHQLVLVPLAVHVFKDQPGVLRALRLYVHHTLSALLVHGNVEDSGVAAPGDDVPLKAIDPAVLQMVVVEHVPDL